MNKRMDESSKTSNEITVKKAEILMKKMKEIKKMKERRTVNKEEKQQWIKEQMKGNK